MRDSCPSLQSALSNRPSRPKPKLIPGKGTLKEQMEAYEAIVIKARIEELPTLKGAARSLGIDTSTLVRKNINIT